MDRRLRQRRMEVQRTERRRRRRRIASVALLLVIAASAVVVSRSPLFAIADVQVIGIGGEPAEQVRRVVRVRPGHNLLDADLAAAEERVEGLPWVERAGIDQIPPSTVVVEVVPRPAAAVLRTDDASWVLGPDGVVIDGGERDGAPAVVADGLVVPPLGEPIDHPGVRAALGMIDAMPRDLADRVEGYRVNGAHVTVTLETGDLLRQDQLDVVIGSVDRLGDKLAVARAMLAVLADETVSDEELPDEAVPDEELPDEAPRGHSVEPERRTARDALRSGTVVLDVRAPDRPVVR